LCWYASAWGFEAYRHNHGATWWGADQFEPGGITRLRAGTVAVGILAASSLVALRDALSADAAAAGALLLRPMRRYAASVGAFYIATAGIDDRERGTARRQTGGAVARSGECSNEAQPTPIRLRQTRHASGARSTARRLMRGSSACVIGGAWRPPAKHDSGHHTGPLRGRGCGDAGRRGCGGGAELLLWVYNKKRSSSAQPTPCLSETATFDAASRPARLEGAAKLQTEFKAAV
jgi:hypothetical protein